MTVDNGWLDTYYGEVGREIGLASSQLHDTTNWSVGITVGALTGIALSGAPYPTRMTLAVAVVALVLVTRFFVRSCLAYANLSKWSKIHRAITAYRFDGAEDKARMEDVIRNAVREYHVKWGSPLPLRRIICANLKLAYLYLFVILGAISAVGFARAQWHDPWTWAVAVGLAASIIYECAIFPFRTYLKHSKVAVRDSSTEE